MLLQIPNSTVKGREGGGGRGGSYRKRDLSRGWGNAILMSPDEDGTAGHMADTPQVIWLRACLRCWPYRGDDSVCLTVESGVIIDYGAPTLGCRRVLLQD